MITCDDGTTELEILHTGPPCRTEHTIDRRRFARRGVTARTLSIGSRDGFQDALELIRATLCSAADP